MLNFELEETLRQQRDQLLRWIEEVKFPEQERRVYELDMQTDYDTEAIARDLNIATETVRTNRKRYHGKIRKVRNYRHAPTQRVGHPNPRPRYPSLRHRWRR